MHIIWLPSNVGRKSIILIDFNFNFNFNFFMKYRHSILIAHMASNRIFFHIFTY